MAGFNEAMVGILEKFISESDANYEKASAWTRLISNLQTQMMILNPRLEDTIDETKAELDAN